MAKDMQGRLNDLSMIVTGQINDPACKIDPYMLGMANGLILAQATIIGVEPEYLDGIHTEGVDTLQAALTKLVNRFSRESRSNTPDYILSAYLMNCLAAFESGITARARWWHGCEPLKAKGQDPDPAKADPDFGDKYDCGREEDYQDEAARKAQFAKELTQMFKGVEPITEDEIPPPTATELRVRDAQAAKLAAGYAPQRPPETSFQRDQDEIVRSQPPECELGKLPGEYEE